MVKIPWMNGREVEVEFSPRWTDDSEVPLYVKEYAEADVRVFGSGTAALDLLELPITVMVPVAVSGTRVVFALHIDRRRELSMALRKITQVPGSPGGGGPGAADAAAWPTLIEYLTTDKYPDGSARLTSSMTILADGNGWRGCLSDKDNGRVLWKTATTLEGLLLALEEAAASDDPTHWRQSSDAKWKGRKRS